jgi:hypothetical protein
MQFLEIIEFLVDNIADMRDYRLQKAKVECIGYDFTFTPPVITFRKYHVSTKQSSKFGDERFMFDIFGELCVEKCLNEIGVYERGHRTTEKSRNNHIVALVIILAIVRWISMLFLTKNSFLHKRRAKNSKGFDFDCVTCVLESLFQGPNLLFKKIKPRIVQLPKHNDQDGDNQLENHIRNY